MIATPYFIEQLVGHDFRVPAERGWAIYHGIKIVTDGKQRRYLICGTFDEFGNIGHTYTFRECDFEKLNVHLLKENQKN